MKILHLHLCLIIPHSRAPANGGMGGGRSNGVSAGAQAQIEDLTTQVFFLLFCNLVENAGSCHLYLSLVGACLAKSCAQVLAEVKAKKTGLSKISLTKICTGKPS